MNMLKVNIKPKTGERISLEFCSPKVLIFLRKSYVFWLTKTLDISCMLLCYKAT